MNLKEEKKEEVVEEFLDGLTNWFTGNSLPPTPSIPPNLPISTNALLTTNRNPILEKKINNNTLLSGVNVPGGNTFPPLKKNGNIDDFKDSDNNDLFKNTMNLTERSGDNKIKTPNNVISFKETMIDSSIEKANMDNSKTVQQKMQQVPDTKVPDTKVPDTKVPDTRVPDMKSVFSKCKFYEKCPANHTDLGGFSIDGVSSKSMMTCGDVKKTKPAHAIAQIKNNAIYEIHITEQGEGFNKDGPPNVSIEGGKGNGATAEAVVDDEGHLKLIRIIHPGYNYTETPNVFIDPPLMNSSCHLCCNFE